MLSVFDAQQPAAIHRPVIDEEAILGLSFPACRHDAAHSGRFRPWWPSPGFPD